MREILDYITHRYTKKAAVILLIISAMHYPMQAYSSEAEEQSTELISEYQLKAAFVYRFVQLIDNNWPVSGQNVDICVSGDKNALYALQKIDVKSINNHPIIVKYRKIDFKKCNVIYFTQLEDDKVKKVLLPLTNSNILTIGENRYFNDYGGVVEFYKYRGKIRFRINHDNAKKSGIQFNAKLLELGNTEE
jgi:hypothetical protein